MDIGPRLVDARRKRGLRQSTIAKILGVRQGVVWRWETGERYPSDRYWYRLEELLGIAVAEFEKAKPRRQFKQEVAREHP